MTASSYNVCIYTHPKPLILCGNVFEGGSVLKEIRVDTCSQCHPFYTGKQKFAQAAGQVDKFNKRVAKKTK